MFETVRQATSNIFVLSPFQVNKSFKRKLKMSRTYSWPMASVEVRQRTDMAQWRGERKIGNIPIILIFNGGRRWGERGKEIGEKLQPEN